MKNFFTWLCQYFAPTVKTTTDTTEETPDTVEQEGSDVTRLIEAALQVEQTAITIGKTIEESIEQLLGSHKLIVEAIALLPDDTAATTAKTLYGTLQQIDEILLNISRMAVNHG